MNTLLFIIEIISFAIWGSIVWIFKLLTTSKKEKEKERLKNIEIQKEKMRKEKEYEQKLKFSLTCKRCGELAFPVNGTQSNYYCESCGNRFTSVKHPFN